MRMVPVLSLERGPIHLLHACTIDSEWPTRSKCFYNQFFYSEYNVLLGLKRSIVNHAISIDVSRNQSAVPELAEDYLPMEVLVEFIFRARGIDTA